MSTSRRIPGKVSEPKAALSKIFLSVWLDTRCVSACLDRISESNLSIWTLEQRQPFHAADHEMGLPFRLSISSYSRCLVEGLRFQWPSTSRQRCGTSFPPFVQSFDPISFSSQFLGYSHQAHDVLPIPWCTAFNDAEERRKSNEKAIQDGKQHQIEATRYSCCISDLNPIILHYGACHFNAQHPNGYKTKESLDLFVSRYGRISQHVVSCALVFPLLTFAAKLFEPVGSFESNTNASRLATVHQSSNFVSGLF